MVAKIGTHLATSAFMNQAFTKSELIPLLQERGLIITGNRLDLIVRLQDFDAKKTSQNHTAGFHNMAYPDTAAPGLLYRIPPAKTVQVNVTGAWKPILRLETNVGSTASQDDYPEILALSPAEDFDPEDLALSPVQEQHGFAAQKVRKYKENVGRSSAKEFALTLAEEYDPEDLALSPVQEFQGVQVRKARKNKSARNDLVEQLARASIRGESPARRMQKPKKTTSVQDYSEEPFVPSLQERRVHFKRVHWNKTPSKTAELLNVLVSKEMESIAADVSPKTIPDVKGKKIEESELDDRSPALIGKRKVMVEVTVDEARQLKKQRLLSRLEKELEIDMVPPPVKEKRSRKSVVYAE